MKSYGQLCAVARALDVVGDRWTLLLVRELLIGGELRFGQLQRGLPGIAPNLLAQRLRDLEAEGVLERLDLGRAGDRRGAYRLTERGRALEGVTRELLKWGAPTVRDAPADAVFQMHWLSQPARYLLRDGEPDAPAVVVRFGDLDDGFDVRIGGGTVETSPCGVETEPATVVSGPGPVLVGLIQGALPLEAARRAGAAVAGDEAALRRALPARAA